MVHTQNPIYSPIFTINIWSYLLRSLVIGDIFGTFCGMFGGGETGEAKSVGRVSGSVGRWVGEGVGGWVDEWGGATHSSAAQLDSLSMNYEALRDSRGNETTGSETTVTAAPATRHGAPGCPDFREPKEAFTLLERRSDDARTAARSQPDGS